MNNAEQDSHQEKDWQQNLNSCEGSFFMPQVVDPQKLDRNENLEEYLQVNLKFYRELMPLD